MRGTEREREAETQVEGEAGSMQEAWCGTQSQDPRTKPWAKGNPSTAEPPRRPCSFNFLYAINPKYPFGGARGQHRQAEPRVSKGNWPVEAPAPRWLKSNQTTNGFLPPGVTCDDSSTSCLYCLWLDIIKVCGAPEMRSTFPSECLD